MYERDRAKQVASNRNFECADYAYVGTSQMQTYSWTGGIHQTEIYNKCVQLQVFWLWLGTCVDKSKRDLGWGSRKCSCMRPILYKLHLEAVWVNFTNFYSPHSDCLCLSVKAPQVNILMTVNAHWHRNGTLNSNAYADECYFFCFFLLYNGIIWITLFLSLQISLLLEA